MNNTKGAIIIEGHVQGLANVRTLGEMGLPIIVIDKNNCIARYSKYCKKYFKCPDYASDEFISFLLELGIRENCKGWSLIPSNDHIVYNLSKNKEKISSIFKTIVPEFELFRKVNDKYEFLKCASNAGIPTPRTFLYNKSVTADRLTNLHNGRQSFASLPYPVLLKGREGLTFFKASGKKAFVVNNICELEETITELTNKIESEKIILQEMIPIIDSSDVWSFTGFAIDGETKTFWIGKKLREHPVKFGTATLAMSDYDERVEDYGKRVIKAFTFTGVCEVEFIRDKRDGSFKLIEMNQRTWLWVGLARHCGIDFTKYIYDYLNEVSIVYPMDYKKNIKWINFWSDFFFSGKAIFKKELTIKEYFSQMKGPVIQTIYAKKDIMPFVMMTLLLPYLASKRI